MNRLWISIVFLLILSIFLSYFYFKPILQAGAGGEPLAYIPDSTALIVQINSAEAFKAQNQMIHPLLIPEEDFQSLQVLEQIFISNPRLKNILKWPLYMSMDFTEGKKSELFVMQFQAEQSLLNPGVLFKDFLAGKNRLEKENFQGLKLMAFTSDSLEAPFYIYEQKGLLLGSHSKDLLLKSVDNFKVNKGEAPRKFLALREHTNRNALATVFLSYKNLSHGFTNFFNLPEKDASMHSLSQLADYSIWDVQITGGALYLTGWNKSGEDQWMPQLLHKQEAIELEADLFLPDKVAYFWHFALSKPFVFQEQIEKMNSSEEDIKLRDIWKDRLDRAPSSLFENILGNEFIQAQFAANSSYTRALFVECLNPDELQRILFSSKLEEPFSEEMESYLGVKIGRFTQSGLEKVLFGKSIGGFNNSFFAIYKEQWIVADELNDLKSILEDVISNNTLKHSEEYIQFRDRVASRSNFMMFAKSKSIALTGEKHFPSFYQRLMRKDSSTQNIFGTCYQISANGNVLLSNFVMSRELSPEKESSLLLKVKLKNPVKKKPHLVINHYTGEKEIMVQDEGKILYLISREGKILWDAELKEEILGDIHVVDYYKNGKFQFLFGTETSLYLIDRNGYLVGNYPMQLPARATVPISLFDYENNKDYRIFVPVQGGKIFVYKLTGRPIKEWYPKNLKSDVSSKIIHTVVKGKDYIFVPTRGGELILFDRRGIVRSRSEFENSKFEQDFFFQRSNKQEKNRFVGVDQNGEIFAINTLGDVQRLKVGTWSPDHYFLCSDFDNNESLEFVYLDKNDLFVFESTGQLRFNYRFVNDIFAAPEIFKLESKKALLGVHSTIEDQVYLFRDEGSLLSGFPLEGSTEFILSDLGISNSRNLIVGSYKGFLYVYQIN